MIPPAAKSVRRAAASLRRRWALAALVLVAAAAALFALGPAGATAAHRDAAVPSIGMAVAASPGASTTSRDRVCVEAAEAAGLADPALPAPAADAAAARDAAATVYPVLSEIDPRPVAGGSPLRPPRPV